MPQERLVISGGPLTGKTQLSDEMAAQGDVGPVKHTDDLIHLGWSEASAAAAEWMTEPGPWLIEGVAGVRALRKALDLVEGAPCDRLLMLSKAHLPLTKGQSSMAKGVRTVFDEIAPELQRRGVDIVVG